MFPLRAKVLKCTFGDLVVSQVPYSHQTISKGDEHFSWDACLGGWGGPFSD